MSRLAKKLIVVPQGVTLDLLPSSVIVKGQQGEVRVPLHSLVEVLREEGGLKVSPKGNLKKRDRALVGTTFRLLLNALEGVTKGYEKKLEVNGVGFKVALSGQALNLSLGYSHPVVFEIPAQIKASVEKNVITLSGCDKQQVGEIAAQIRALRKPEPYKGSGIKYRDEVIRRKAGKQVKAAGTG